VLKLTEYVTSIPAVLEEHRYGIVADLFKPAARIRIGKDEKMKAMLLNIKNVSPWMNVSVLGLCILATSARCSSAQEAKGGVSYGE